MAINAAILLKLVARDLNAHLYNTAIPFSYQIDVAVGKVVATTTISLLKDEASQSQWP